MWLLGARDAGSRPPIHAQARDCFDSPERASGPGAGGVCGRQRLAIPGAGIAALARASESLQGARACSSRLGEAEGKMAARFRAL